MSDLAFIALMFVTLFAYCFVLTLWTYDLRERHDRLLRRHERLHETLMRHLDDHRHPPRSLLTAWSVGNVQSVDVDAGWLTGNEWPEEDQARFVEATAEAMRVANEEPDLPDPFAGTRRAMEDLTGAIGRMKGNDR